MTQMDRQEGMWAPGPGRGEVKGSCIASRFPARLECALCTDSEPPARLTSLSRETEIVLLSLNGLCVC